VQIVDNQDSYACALCCVLQFLKEGLCDRCLGISIDANARAAKLFAFSHHRFEHPSFARAGVSTNKKFPAAHQSLHQFGGKLRS